jgi:uncharacterized membrane protein
VVNKLMIDLIINNPKAILVAVMPIVIMIPISIYSVVARRNAEIAVLKEYKETQVDRDGKVLERGLNLIQECKTKVYSIKGDMAGDAETMAEFDKVSEKLDYIRLNIESITMNHATVNGWYKKALENLPTELDLESVMYIYVSYGIGVLVYKWWTTGSLVSSDSDIMGMVET